MEYVNKKGGVSPLRCWVLVGLLAVAVTGLRVEALPWVWASMVLAVPLALADAITASDSEGATDGGDTGEA